MNDIKVMTVFGTRPEAIKVAPLIKELEKRENIKSIVCVTAQHREMLDQVIETFNINVDYDLDIMEKGQSLNDITCKILNKLPLILNKENPNIILVNTSDFLAFCTVCSVYSSAVNTVSLANSK